MGNLERKQNNLIKAQRRFEKVAGKNQEYKIKFERTEDKSSGKFKTTVSLVKGDKGFKYKKAGVLHATDYAVNNRIIGDKPSVTKAINSWKPTTKKGQAVKLTVKSVNFAVHKTAKLTKHTGLLTETAVLKAGNTVGRFSINHAKNKFNAEVNSSNADVAKMSATTVKAIKRGVGGLNQHHKLKKNYRYTKADFKLAKADYKVFKADSFKQGIEANKLKVKDLKKLNKSRIKLKKTQKKVNARVHSSVAKSPAIKKSTSKRVLKPEIKLDKKILKIEKKQLLSTKKFKKKEMKNKKKIKNLSKPTPLLLMPVKAGSKKIAASSWQKAISADERNDLMKAASSAKSGYDKFKGAKKSKLHKKQKKQNKLQKKEVKKKNKLQSKDKKLQKKKSVLDEKWKKGKYKKKKKKKLLSSKPSQLERIATKLFAYMMSSVMIILLLVYVLLTLFNSFGNSVSSGSAVIAEVYTAQDKYLSQAEEYYTEMAQKYNIQLCGIYSSDWKKNLKKFAVDTSDMDTEPDEFVFGRSDKLNYDPVYDFDRFKFWSFLCAYYYNYSSEEIEYWSFDSDVKSVIKDLFADEYLFQYNYDDVSEWVKKQEYEYFGGGSGSTGGRGEYYMSEAPQRNNNPDDERYTYVFKPVSCPSDLSEYKKDGELYLRKVNGEYRIVDPNNKWHLTGYIVPDTRFYVDDHAKKTFYYHLSNRELDDCSSYYFDRGTTRYYRDTLGWNNEDGSFEYAWFMIPPENINQWLRQGKYAPKSENGEEESENTEEVDEPDEWGWYCVKKYYWKEECTLYYNVKRIITFDSVIENTLKDLDNGEERYQLYQMYSGEDEDSNDLRGGHQTFKLLDISSDELLEENKILHWYGYDMQQWGNLHCYMEEEEYEHQAIDILLDKGTPVYAPCDCEIKDYDDDNHIITLRKPDYLYFYDGDGNGKQRDTEFVLENVELDPYLEEGENISEGTLVGNVIKIGACDKKEYLKHGESYLHLKIELDTDGPGWHFVDPILLLE